MTPTPSAAATAVPAGAPSAAAALAHRPFDLTGAVLEAWPDIAGGGWLAHALVAAALWGAIAIAVEGVLVLGRRLGRRSSTEIDDILVYQLRGPLRAMLAALFVADVIDAFGPLAQAGGVPGPAAVPRAVMTVAAVAVVAAAVWIATVVIEHGVVRGLASLAGRTRTRFDDQLTPLVRLISRPLVWMLGALFALDLVGVSVRSLALVVGGTSFVLAFALKESLEDLFSGIMLFVDQPFEPNDVLQLEDGTICEVQRTALRTTHLYDASAHTLVVMPNRVLAGQKLTNLSRPSPDLKLVVRVAVAHDADHGTVVARLKAAAEGHPWVVGDRDVKLAALRARIARLAWNGRSGEALHVLRELARVETEGDARAAVARLSRQLLRLSSASHNWERGGFNESERHRVATSLAEIERTLAEVQAAVATWLLCVRFSYVVGNHMGLPDGSIDRLRSAAAAIRGDRVAATADDLQRLGEACDAILAPAFDHVRAYVDFARGRVADAIAGKPTAYLVLLPSEITDARQALYLAEGQERLFERTAFGAGIVDADSPDGGIPDLDAVNEYLRRYVEWSRKCRQLSEMVAELVEEHRRGSGRRLDEMLLALHKWLAYDFLEVGPTWKYPSVAIANFDNGRHYDLKCYVDDVRLAHYTRANKVAEQLRADILALFEGLAPTVPFGGPVITVGFSPHGAPERPAG